MLDAIVTSSASFWVVAFLIVAADSAILLAPGEFAFCFDKQGQPHVRVHATPFLMRQREVLVSAVTFFGRPVLLSSVGVAAVAQAQIEGLRRLTSCVQSLQLYALVPALLLFVVGPVLTALIGISRTLLLVVPIIYVNAACALICIAVMRHELQLQTRKLLYIIFEFAVCPPIVINIGKHLIDVRSILPNTLQLIGEDVAVRARIDANLDYQGFKIPMECSPEHG
jgi:hypothetical protein